MFRDQGGSRLGVLRSDEVIDVGKLAALAGIADAPHDMLELIDQGASGLGRLRDLLAAQQVDQLDRRSFAHSLSAVEVLPPLNPPRGNVFAIGRNYEKHAAEGARVLGRKIEPPTVFTKAQTSISGPYSDIVIDPHISLEMDWEAELGVVIGRRGKNISAQQALDHVFGYTVVNDISARDIQMGWGGQFFKGKSLDGTCPIGPWIVTSDEIADPQNLRIALRINGVTKQEAHTSEMTYTVEELVSRLSEGMTLLPGNLITTGTPEGVGFARSPAEFLQPGDVMETEIEAIGLMRNRMVSA